jgi:hypothetical protein
MVIFDHRAALDSPDRSKPVKAADVKNHTAAVLNRAYALVALIDKASLEV